MTPKERKKHRLDLLKEIYDFKYDKNGEPYKVSISKDDENSERHLAIRYLIDNGYVTNNQPDYNNYTLKISYKGIDLIEDIY